MSQSNFLNPRIKSALRAYEDNRPHQAELDENYSKISAILKEEKAREKYLEQFPIAEEILKYIFNLEDFDERVLKTIEKRGEVDIITLSSYYLLVTKRSIFDIKNIPIVLENNLTDKDISNVLNKNISIKIENEDSIFNGWLIETVKYRIKDTLFTIHLVNPASRYNQIRNTSNMNYHTILCIIVFILYFTIFYLLLNEIGKFL